MAVTTKDLIIDIYGLTEDLTITNPKQSALYFKGKTYADVIDSFEVTQDDWDKGKDVIINLKGTEYKIIR